MAKTTLKTVERKTTVPREAIIRAFAEVRAERDKDTSSVAGSDVSRKTDTRKSLAK